MHALYFFIQSIYLFFLKHLNIKSQNKPILLASKHPISDEQISDVKVQLEFHFAKPPIFLAIPEPSLTKRIGALLTGTPILWLGRMYSPSERIWLNEFNIDPTKCHVAAWSWHRLTCFLGRSDPELSIDKAKLKAKFSQLKNQLHRRNHRAFVFGTGPSLASATNFDFSDGIRIACNTMVKSDTLWKHIDPDIIVAGDAIHHFSNTPYANNFRRDLRIRLSQKNSLIFFYPSDFHPFLAKEFSDLKEQMFPMPTSIFRNPFSNRPMALPHKAPNENVLTMLQLPIASRLSKTIYFLGFDGRGKNDSGFWKSSDDYNYIDELSALRQTYPAFFKHYLESSSDKNSYVKKVHGDKLDKFMKGAEAAGFELFSLAQSNTETFQKRYVKEIRR